MTSTTFLGGSVVSERTSATYMPYQSKFFGLSGPSSKVNGPESVIQVMHKV